MSVVDLMVPIFLAFREGIEAVLVIVIILLYLKNTDQRFYNKYVYIGSALAIFSSIIFAVIFTSLFGGFSDTGEQIFEGVTFIISGIFVLTLVLWMSKEGPKMKKHLEEKVEFSIESGRVLSIAILTYIIIIREGIELVLLLTGATSVGSLNQVNVILGSLTGLGISLGFGLLIYYGVKNINLSKFFKITNVILILFVAGLITYGVHELIEAGVVNPIIQEVWNIKHILPENFPDGNLLTPEWLEIIGSLLKALFGYNANPSLLEIILYPSILISIGIISLKLWKRTKSILIMDIEEEKQSKISLD
ncbi:MAG: FTR1 family iron permease [Promethearchaeota archaeon]|jgi:high-affinity iron transporter